MANQKKPNSKNLTEGQNPVIGDETEELDFEKILAEFGGTDQQEASETETAETQVAPEKDGVEAAASSGTETAGRREPVRNDTPNGKGTDPSASGDPEKRVQGRKISQDLGRVPRNKPERVAMSESERTARQGDSVRNEEKSGTAGQPGRGAGAGLKQSYGRTSQQAGSAGWQSSSPMGAARPAGSSGNAGHQTGYAGRQNDNAAGATGQARTSGTAGQHDNATGTAQPQSYGNTGRQNSTSGAGQPTTFGSTSQRISGTGSSASQAETIDLVEVFYSNTIQMISTVTLMIALCKIYKVEENRCEHIDCNNNI